MDAFDSIGEERLTHARWPPQQRGSGISCANERSHPRAGRTSDNLLSGRSALAAVRASGPTLVSVEIWSDAASAENAFRSGLVTWENDPRQPDAPIVY